MSPLQFGDLWMRLQLMWLQFEVVRGPVGVWGRLGAPKPAPNRPQMTAPDPRTPDPRTPSSFNGILK